MSFRRKRLRRSRRCARAAPAGAALLVGAFLSLPGCDLRLGFGSVGAGVVSGGPPASLDPYDGWVMKAHARHVHSGTLQYLADAAYGWDDPLADCGGDPTDCPTYSCKRYTDWTHTVPIDLLGCTGGDCECRAVSSAGVCPTCGSLGCANGDPNRRVCSYAHAWGHPRQHWDIAEAVGLDALWNTPHQQNINTDRAAANIPDLLTRLAQGQDPGFYDAATGEYLERGAGLATVRRWVFCHGAAGTPEQGLQMTDDGPYAGECMWTPAGEVQHLESVWLANQAAAHNRERNLAGRNEVFYAAVGGEFTTSGTAPPTCAPERGGHKFVAYRVADFLDGAPPRMCRTTGSEPTQQCGEETLIADALAAGTTYNATHPAAGGSSAQCFGSPTYDASAARGLEARMTASSATQAIEPADQGYPGNTLYNLLMSGIDHGPVDGNDSHFAPSLWQRVAGSDFGGSSGSSLGTAARRIGLGSFSVSWGVESQWAHMPEDFMIESERSGLNWTIANEDPAFVTLPPTVPKLWAWADLGAPPDPAIVAPDFPGSRFLTASRTVEFRVRLDDLQTFGGDKTIRLLRGGIGVAPVVIDSAPCTPDGVTYDCELAGSYPAGADEFYLVDAKRTGHEDEPERFQAHSFPIWVNVDASMFDVTPTVDPVNPL